MSSSDSSAPLSFPLSISLSDSSMIRALFTNIFIRSDDSAASSLILDLNLFDPANAEADLTLLPDFAGNYLGFLAVLVADNFYS